METTKLKSPSTTQLISAQDKYKKILKIAVIQPSKAKDVSEDKVIELKFNMNQFSVVDKVAFLKQTSERICSYIISTSVTKDKLQRDYKKMENKLKTKTVEKKALQIKKTELEKKVLEISRGSGNDTLNKIILDKD